MLESIKNFRRVDERLATAGQPTEAQLDAVAMQGFEVVINLALHDDPRYSLPDEAAHVKSLGLRYVHIPVQFAHPTEQDLLAFFEAMDENASRRVFVHCAANWRVSAFLGLHGVIRQGKTREEAFELMRGLWEANEVWSAFIDDMLVQHAR